MANEHRCDGRANFYVYCAGAAIVLAALWFGGIDTGWTFYTPYSATSPTLGRHRGVRRVRRRGVVPRRCVPRSVLRLPGDARAGAQLFFTLYYFMTGLHALHMIGGLAAIGWVTARVVRGRTTAAYPLPLELGALYWHLVDSIWIFLWPMFYLTTG